MVLWLGLEGPGGDVTLWLGPEGPGGDVALWLGPEGPGGDVANEHIRQPTRPLQLVLRLGLES